MLTTAFNSTTGFLYGASTLMDTPDYIQSGISTQSVSYTGSPQSGLLTNMYPGITNIARVNATGSAGGANSELDYISTAFTTQTTPKISSMTIAPSNTLKVSIPSPNVRYITYTNGWNISSSVTKDIFFFSTPTSLNYSLSSQVQFNDASLPGDRSTITVKTYLTGDLVDTMTLSTFNNDFRSTTTYTNATVNLSDAFNTLGYKRQFYNMNANVNQYISTESLAHNLMVSLQNNVLDPTMRSQTLSSIQYPFIAEQLYPFKFSTATYTDTQQPVYVSGILTPDTNSKICYDIVGQNFLRNLASVNFASANATRSSIQVGVPLDFNTSTYFYENGLQITTLPFPLNTDITMSSLTARFSTNLYQNPRDPQDIIANITVYPENPLQAPSTISVNLTSNYFADTVSANLISSFTDALGQKGKRILSIIPNANVSTLANNILDGLSSIGGIPRYGQGLNTGLSSFIVLTSSVMTVSNSLNYDHTESLMQTYPSYYSRELIFTNGLFMNPSGPSAVNGLNFSIFDPHLIDSSPLHPYPNFINNLAGDSNGGYRYVSFLFDSSELSPGVNYNSVDLTVHNCNRIAGISALATNEWFPNGPISAGSQVNTKVRIHMKTFYKFNTGVNQPSAETNWMNCLVITGTSALSPTTPYDTGIQGSASINGNNITYKLKILGRTYLRTLTVVRIGIRRETPISFSHVTAQYSPDILT